MPSKDFNKLLSPQEIALQEYETREKIAAEDRERKADFYEEERTLDRDPEATMTASGKQIRRAHMRKGESSSDAKFRRMMDMMNLSPSAPRGIIPTVIDLMKDTLGNAFSRPAAPPPAHVAHIHEDKDYYYETAKVSPQTLKVLTKEFGLVQAKIEEIEIARAKHPLREEKLVLELKGLVAEFQMRQHPVTHRYVHDIERVKEEEAKWNPKLEPDLQIGLALVYRAKAYANDDRGIKSRVADVLDNNPQEVNKSGAHMSAAEKGPNAPSP